MDMLTGETYATREEAVKAGVPDSDIAETVRGDSSIPEVRFSSGPFKNRVYKQNPNNGQLIRMDIGNRAGYVTKNDGAGHPVRVKV